MSLRKLLASSIGITPLWRIAEYFHHMPRILFYHGVMDEPVCESRVQANQIQFYQFEKQIRFFKKYYHFISIDEFYHKFISRERFSGKELLITFDDGYENNLTVAAPFLKQLDIPFVVFVSTDCINNGYRVPTYYVRSAIYEQEIKSLYIPFLNRTYSLNNNSLRMACCKEMIEQIKTVSQEKVNIILSDIEANLTPEIRQKIDNKYYSERLMEWSQVSKIIRFGATIGSHSCDHAILHTQQSSEEIVRQLLESKKAIENHIGDCRYFAFPNGDIYSVCDASLEMAGDYYQMSFAVDGKPTGWGNNLNYVSRIGLCNDFYASRSQFSILSLLK